MSRTKYYYGKSMRQVYEQMSVDEKELVKNIMGKKVLTPEGLMSISYNKLSLKDSQKKEDLEFLAEIKKIAFENTERNCLWSAWLQKAMHPETRLSVMDLFGVAYASLEKAWENFLNKSDEEVQKKIDNEKPIYANFMTYSDYVIQDALTIEVYKTKNMDKNYQDISLSKLKKIRKMSNFIQSFIAMRGKYPTDEQIASGVDITLNIVKEYRYYLNCGTFNEKDDVFEGMPIVDDVAFRAESQTQNMTENSREKFWTEVKKILTNKEYAVLNLLLRQNMKQYEVADILQIARSTVKVIYTEAVSKIVGTDSLVDYLSYLAKPIK